ncbi:MAG: TetR/AcrR family transcriptional regulator [Lachnospiraceae bacterium]|nr:TetR/AcrR family transcriptional regulator [Lachnospiraceae bacterium]
MTKGEKTKKHLYQCSLELFREKGYDNVSVNEIVEKAGTAKGTFYVHFSSKAAVISEMFHEYDAYYKTLEEQMDPEASVTERLEEFIRASCNFTEKKIGLDLIRVLYIHQLTEGTIEQDALRSDRELYRIIKTFLLHGQTKGELRADFDIQQITDYLIRSIRGTFYEWAMKEGAFSLTEECVSYIRVFLSGLIIR